MKKLLTILLASLLTVGVVHGATNLTEYYQEKGQKLPSLEVRKEEAKQCGIENYTGTSEQNTKLLQCKKPLTLGAGFYSPATAVGNGSAILGLNNTFTGNNTFTKLVTMSGGVSSTQATFNPGPITVTNGVNTTTMSAATTTYSKGSTATPGGAVFYNTTDETVNYERGTILWSSNVFQIQANSAGSGNARNLSLNTKNTPFTIAETASASGFYQFSRGTATAGAVGTAFNATTWGASSGVSAIVQIAPTVANSGSGAYSALQIRPIETSLGTGVSSLIQAGTSTAPGLFTVDNSGNLTTSGTLALRTIPGSNAGLLNVDSSGNLSVSGTAQFYATSTFRAGPGLGSVTSSGRVYLNSISTGSGNDFLCRSATTGEIIDGGATTCAVSSRRFKQGIEYLTPDLGLAEVLKLKPAAWYYKTELNKDKDQHMSLIAEDAGSVDTRLTGKDKDGKDLNLDANAMNNIMILAIQEQQRHIEDLESRLEALESHQDTSDSVLQEFSKLLHSLVSKYGGY